MADFARGGSPLKPMLASGARTASGEHVCGICGQVITARSREAQLPDGSYAHLWPCIARGGPS